MIFAVRSATGVAADFTHSVGGLAMGDAEPGVCSAVFFEADRALTVGHCLAAPERWHALPNPKLRVVLAGRRLDVVKIEMSPVSPFAADGRIVDLGNDWAILTVAVPPDLAQPLPFVGSAGARAVSITGDILIKVGMHERMLRQTDDCAMRAGEADLRVFFFRCGEGLGSGASGSALLMHRGEGYALIGVQSAKGRRGGEVIGVGVVPPDEVMQR